MKALLEILIVVRIMVVSTVELDFNVIDMKNDWSSARDICHRSEKFLIADQGLAGFVKLRIFDSLATDELVWINAKSVEVIYQSGTSAYIKLAYQPAEVKLTTYLCHKTKSKEINKNDSTLPVSWKETQELCSRSSAGSTLFNISNPKQMKQTVGLLQKDVTFWVDKFAKQAIPNMVSDSGKMREECIGVMKLSDGTLAYRRDNCTFKHKYVCVSPVDAFAPTITKMSEPYTFVSEDQNTETGNTTIGLNPNNLAESEESTLSVGEIGGIVGGSAGSLLVIASVVIVVNYLRWRRRSRRDYLRSLKRYTERHASVRRLLTKTVSGSMPRDRSNCCTIDEPDEQENIGIPEEYEDCEGRDYVHCQNDVVRDIKARYAKYPSPHASAALEMLPGYHTMDAHNNKLQVLPAYETFDPDPGRLQQTHGYVNKDVQPQLSDLDQYDNVPTLPRKQGKTNALDQLDEYENQTVGNKRIVGKNGDGKVQGNTDRKTVLSLEELEQYENYNVPKREKGFFRLFKAEKANRAKSESKEAKKKAVPNDLNDLDEYENLESPKPGRKEIRELKDLDAYENHAVN